MCIRNIALLSATLMFAHIYGCLKGLSISVLGRAHKATLGTPFRMAWNLLVKSGVLQHGVDKYSMLKYTVILHSGAKTQGKRASRNHSL